MSNSRRPTGDEQAQRWQYPDITSEEHVSSMRRNAVNKPMRWQFEPPEEEPEAQEEAEQAPQLTAEMLEQIREEARQEGLAAGHEEGLKAGHEEGYQAGYDEGLLAGKAAGEEQTKAAGEQITAELSLRWQQLFDHMRQPALQINEGVERQLVAMTASLAQAVCLHEVSTNPQVIYAVVQKAVAELSEQAEQLTLHVHPEDWELINQRWPQAERESLGWKLAQDESLTRGGCVVVTPVTRVDATLEARINDVFKHYIRGMTPSTGDTMRSEPDIDAVTAHRAQQQAAQQQEAQQQVSEPPQSAQQVAGDESSSAQTRASSADQDSPAAQSRKHPPMGGQGDGRSQ
jgi:flagellar assembly protein FliH